MKSRSTHTRIEKCYDDMISGKVWYFDISSFHLISFIRTYSYETHKWKIYQKRKSMFVSICRFAMSLSSDTIPVIFIITDNTYLYFVCLQHSAACGIIGNSVKRIRTSINTPKYIRTYAQVDCECSSISWELFNTLYYLSEFSSWRE